MFFFSKFVFIAGHYRLYIFILINFFRCLIKAQLAKPESLVMFSGQSKRPELTEARISLTIVTNNEVIAKPWSYNQVN